MEKRELGSTGEKLSVIGFGGILVMDETPENASSFVAEAIDRGINYFDVAPSYGNAQERLGPALKPYRQNVFLACKTQKRKAVEAEDELHESLKLLRTDHIDLYQLHAVTTLEEADEVFRKGGAMETLLSARDKGIIRYLGFSAHSEEAALRLLDRFPFDSVLYPINWVIWYNGGFGPALVEKARSMGTGILALKALARTRIQENEARSWDKAWYHPVTSYEDALEGVRFTLSRPVTAAVSPGHIELFRWACRAAEEYSPPSDAELVDLDRRSREFSPLFTRMHA